MPKLIVNQPAQPTGRERATPESFGAAIGRQTQQLGAAEQATAQIGSAWQEQEGTRHASDFYAEFQSQADEIALTGDLATASTKIDQLRKKLQSKHRGGSPGVFDREAKRYGDSIANRANHHVRLRQIDSGRDSLDAAISIHSTLSDRPDVKGSDFASSQMQVEALIRRAVESGFINEGEAVLKMQEFLSSRTTRVRKRAGQTLTDGIFEKTDDDGKPITDSQKLKLARSIEDPDLRDDVVSRLKNRITERNNAETELLDTQDERLWNAAETAVREGRYQEAVDLLEDEPGRGKTRKAVLEYITKTRDAEMESDPDERDKTQAMNWKRIKQLRINNPKKFLEEDFWQLWASGEITDDDRDEFLDARKQLQTDGADSGRGLSKKVEEFANRHMDMMGIPASNDPKAMAKRARVEHALERQIRVAENQPGRTQPVSYQEKTEILQSVLSDFHVDEGIIFDDVERFVDIAPDDVTEYVQDAMKADSPIRAELIENIKAQGVDIQKPKQLEQMGTTVNELLAKEAIEYFDIRGADMVEARKWFRDHFMMGGK